MVDEIRTIITLAVGLIIYFIGYSAGKKEGEK